jgi:hypothetical protein
MSSTRSYKIYDVHQTEEETIMYQESQEDMEEEIFLQSLLEAGDEDAVIINDFEEAILTACQESAELAPCFASYQEARQCLPDKAKSRGFWPLGSGKGRTKGKKGKFGAPNKGSMSTNQQANFHRRSLADHIGNSTCRKCGQPGHWKRECPLSTTSSSSASMSSLGAKKNYENESFTGILHEEEHGTSTEFGDDLKWGVDVVEELPEEAVAYEEDGNPKDQILNRPQGDWINGSDQIGNFDGVVYDCLVSVSALTRSLTSCITTCCRKHDVLSARPAAETTPPPNSPREETSQTNAQVAPTS